MIMNYTVPENTPQTNITTKTSDTELNWTGAEGIVCLLLAGNLPDTP